MKYCKYCEGEFEDSHWRVQVNGRGENRLRCRKLLSDTKKQWRASGGGSPSKNRNSMLKWSYGITQEDYDAMVIAQGDRCAICGTIEKGGNSKKYWHVDHNHETGRVRGLLCHRCNVAIGFMKENQDTLYMAQVYLLQDIDVLNMDKMMVE